MSPPCYPLYIIPFSLELYERLTKSIISILKGLSALMGPPRDNPEKDPIAALHLDNRLCIMCSCQLTLDSAAREDYIKNTTD